MAQARVLIVAADGRTRERRAEVVAAAGFEAVTAADLDAAARVTAAADTAAALIHTDAGQGGEWRALLHKAGAPALIVVASQGDVRDAVQAMRGGAADYLAEPATDADVVAAVRNVAADPAPSGVVASDEALRKLMALADRVADKEVSILLTGESGTGKEVLARYVHGQSRRARGPFVAVNCAAIPENMLEAVLFGYEKGAFTGAHRSHAGKFEQAQGGTILLDEISEIDLGLQAKLLRVLQEREIERLCGQRTISLDVRVLATTNRDLRAMVADGDFREDLFYRLHVFPLHIPPLRERPADILPLAEAFLARHRSEDGAAFRLGDQAAQLLTAHSWPGNVRELENVIQRAVILADDREIAAAAIHFDAVAPTAEATGANRLESEVRGREHSMILDTLQRVGGNRKAAAERLGISERTLRYKLARMRQEGVSIPSRFGAECA